MKIEMTLDKVLIKKVSFDKVNKYSILLLEESKDSMNNFIYEVINVGPGGNVGNKTIEMFVKPGDKVIVKEYNGSEIEIDNEKYRIVNQADILAIVEL